MKNNNEAKQSQGQIEAMADLFKLDTFEYSESGEEGTQHISEEDGSQDEEEESTGEDENSEEEGSGYSEEEEGSEGNQNNEDSDTGEFSFVPFVEDLVANSGLVLDESKEYEDSVEGFREIIEDNIQAGIEAYKDSLGAKALELVEFLEAGGDLTEFMALNEVDYNKIDLDDEDNQQNLVVEHLEKTGHEEAEIEELLEEYKTTGGLARQARIAQKYLAREHEKEVAFAIANKKKEEEDFQRTLEEQTEQLYKTVIETKEIKGIKVTKKEMEQVYDYMVSPIDNKGTTRFIAEVTDEDRLAFAYFKMKGFKFDDLKKEVKSETAQKLKKHLGRYKDNNAITRSESGNRNEGNGGENLHIPDIWG
jgi:hypothetical protein